MKNIKRNLLFKTFKLLLDFQTLLTLWSRGSLLNPGDAKSDRVTEPGQQEPPVLRSVATPTVSGV